MTTTAEAEEDEGIKPLSDRLVAELTAHRTVALRSALGVQPDVAFLAALHSLCLQVFCPYALDSCLELQAAPSSSTWRVRRYLDAECGGW